METGGQVLVFTVATFQLGDGFKMLRKETSVKVFIIDASRLVKRLNKKECRILLRKKIYQLLFSNFGIEEDDLKQNQFGKKYILTSDQDKYFNIAYSHKVAVLAISDEEVGIDVEYLNKMVSHHSRSILNIDFNKEDIEFYYKWTCIGSSSKLRGIGLSNGFRNIRILQETSFESYYKGFCQGSACYFYSKIFGDYLMTICLNNPKAIDFTQKKL